MFLLLACGFGGRVRGLLSILPKQVGFFDQGASCSGWRQSSVSRLEPAVCAKVLTYALGENERYKRANAFARLFANSSAIGPRPDGRCLESRYKRGERVSPIPAFEPHASTPNTPKEREKDQNPPAEKLSRCVTS
jgi:hypothetical protein